VGLLEFAVRRAVARADVASRAALL